MWGMQCLRFLLAVVADANGHRDVGLEVDVGPLKVVPQEVHLGCEEVDATLGGGEDAF